MHSIFAQICRHSKDKDSCPRVGAWFRCQRTRFFRRAMRPLPMVRLPHVVGTMGDFRYGLTGSRDMIRAGTPSTVQLLGTSPPTKEFGHTTTLSPMVRFPNTLHPAPKNTLLPIVGLPSPRMLPMLTSWVSVQLWPIRLTKIRTPTALWTISPGPMSLST